MNPTFFKNTTEWRQWLKENHNNAQELWLGYYKKNSGKENYTWSESVDEAICYGWIDGLRKSVDEESYMIRFTPRRPTSIWSAVNIEKVKTLIEKGLMRPAGIQAWEKRQEKKTKVYSFEQEHQELREDYIQTLKTNPRAWLFFSKKLAPSSRKISIHWVMSAKQEATRLRRLSILIESSEQELKVPLLRAGEKKK
ncbi:MAG: YdeI/OmpD-associated family protein [Saprospiraceae bacterium]|nr:YdeI/OmpD-associated family protein [Saprospiraceae bacterium]MCB9325210.1 YdeI/OmpD-associated family protein [Lewinellaceae bacterium]